MRSPFPLEFARPLLRLLKEIWETKVQLAIYAVLIRVGFGSFDRFWWAMTEAPWSPFIPYGYDGDALVRTSGVVVLEYILLLCAWKLYRRRQSNLPPPWRDVDTKYLVKLSSPSSALRAAHFLYSRVGPDRRQVIRTTPWHFKHTLYSVQSGITLLGLIKFGGCAGVIGAGVGILAIDTVCLVVEQAKAAFGWNDSEVDPKLDYRHKPRFAWAAMVQVLMIAVLLVLVKFGVRPPLFMVGLFPLASLGTLLLYLLHGHEVDYLNRSVLTETTRRHDAPTVRQAADSVGASLSAGVGSDPHGQPVPTAGPRPAGESTVVPHGNRERCNPNQSGSTEVIPWNSTSKFCEVCESTVLSNNKIDDTHHSTASSLQKSAQSGCRICATVWEQRSHIQQDFVSLLKHWQPATTYRRSGGLTIRYKEDVSRLQSCEFQIRGLHVPDRWEEREGSLDIRKRIAMRPLPENTGSEESLSLVVKWLQHCTIYHGVCATNQDEYFRPSRLLFLEHDAVCIHTTRDMPKRIRYLTLSHCWGEVHTSTTKLLESLEDSFRQDIPFSSLPLTFQHAVTITRRLGFSYLWIDSLCIVQDSAADWNHEANLMGKIYQNAYCNIAASDAPDDQHGCLYPRNPRTIQPELVRFGSRNEEEYLINETDIYNNHTLYTRAWVLQEALLARRTLDCGRGQLFWRCGELRASEVFPGGVPTHIYHEDHPASRFKAISAERDQVILNANILIQRLRTDKTMRMLPIAPGKGSVERYTDAPFVFWAAVVAEYTEMKLTRDTDRIVAVAGITDVFRPFFGEHWFGMWRVFMPLELLWEIEGTSPSTVRAPSWSWLSLEGAVSYWKCTFKYRRDVLYTDFISAQSAGDNSTRLRLSTPLLRAKWYGWADKRQRCFLSEIEGQSKRLSYRGIPTLPDVYAEIHFDLWDDRPPDDIFCMCIQLNKEHDQREMRGVVLREVEDGVFERLGIFLDWRSMIEPFLEPDQIPRREIVLV